MRIPVPRWGRATLGPMKGILRDSSSSAPTGVVRAYSVTPVGWGTFCGRLIIGPYGGGAYVFRDLGGMGSPGRAICLIKNRTRCRLASGSDFFKQAACFLNRRGRCWPGRRHWGRHGPSGCCRCGMALRCPGGAVLRCPGGSGEPPAGPVPRLEAAVPDLKSRTIFVDHPCSYSENSLIIKRFKQHTESSPVLSACCSRRLLCQNLKYRNAEAS